MAKQKRCSWSAKGPSGVCSGELSEAGLSATAPVMSALASSLVGTRYQSGGAVIEDHGICMRWWKGDRQYSGRDQKHFHVVLPLKLGARLRVSFRVQRSRRLQCFIDGELEKAWRQLASHPAVGTIKAMPDFKAPWLNKQLASASCAAVIQ